MRGDLSREKEQMHAGDCAHLEELLKGMASYRTSPAPRSVDRCPFYDFGSGRAELFEPLRQ